jgi:hypothetical protein
MNERRPKREAFVFAELGAVRSRFSTELLRCSFFNIGFFFVSFCPPLFLAYGDYKSQRDEIRCGSRENISQRQKN